MALYEQLWTPFMLSTNLTERLSCKAIILQCFSKFLMNLQEVFPVVFDAKVTDYHGTWQLYHQMLCHCLRSKDYPKDLTNFALNATTSRQARKRICKNDAKATEWLKNV